MRASASIQLACDAGDAWAYFANVLNLARWMRGVSHVTVDGDALAREGLRFASEYHYAGQTTAVDWEVMAAQPNHLLELHWTAGPARYRGRLTFSPFRGGTRVDYNAEIATDGDGRGPLLTLFGWAFRWAMSRQMKSDLERDRQAIETRRLAVRKPGNSS